MGAAAAAGVGVASGYVSGSGAVAAAKYQQAIGNKNADMAELQAERIIKKGGKDALNFKKQVKATVGSQRAAMAAQGIDVNDGQAMDIQTETFEIGAQDALTIQNNAYLEAFGMKSNAVDLRAQGEFGVKSAQNNMRMSMITGGMNGLISGGGFKGGGSKGGGDLVIPTKGTTSAMNYKPTPNRMTG